MSTITDFNTTLKPTWCPGCGNFGIFNSLKKALADLGKKNYETVVTFDIGCSGNGADKMNTYAFKSLHGRSIPTACGIKIANPNLTVIATGGDGAIMEEGINHLIWAARNNYDIKVIMSDNQVFGLTTGQPTTTTDPGNPGKTEPWGVIEERINPIEIALASNASFVARSFGFNIEQTTELIKAALQHKGFAFIDVVLPCITFNKVNTLEWFKERVYDLKKVTNYDPFNKENALKVAREWGKKIPTGLIYQDKKSIPYNDRLNYRKEVKSTLVDEVEKFDITKLLEEFN